MVLLCHILALGLALVAYALPHHVIPRRQQALGIVSTRPGARAAAQTTITAAPTEEPYLPVETEAPLEAMAADVQPVATAAPAATPIPTEAPSPEPTVYEEEIVGNFRARFPDKFTSGKVEKHSDSYRSANVNVTMNEYFDEGMQARVYVADIYIADIDCLQAVFAQDTYGRGYTESVESMSERTNSVVAINGDYYGTRDTGIVIRNGVLYRDNKLTRDVAVIYWNGEMKTFRPSEFNAVTEMDNGAYQGWCFGPMLLDENGKAKELFNTEDNLKNRHPRSAIGYFEPGHYCFVAVDGRNEESDGAKLTALSKLMESLGCTTAYNLDGGKTSLLCFRGDLTNDPRKGGRETSDAIIILDQAG